MSRANGNLRILIYGEYFLPVVGGVQTAMNLLAKGLVELNSRPQRGDDQSQITVTVATRTAANGMDDSVLTYRLVRRPGFWRLVKLIRDADVIHVAGPCLLPMAIAWLVGKPFVVEHHGYQAICPNGLLFLEPSRTVCPGYFVQRQYGECVRCTSQTMGSARGVRSVLLTFPRRWLCKKATTNITISDHVATRLKFPRSRTVYYGVEESPLAQVEVAAPPTNPFHVAYIGRLVIEKGPALLLEAVKYLENDGVPFQLSFIGDGPERTQLERLADSLRSRDSLRFTGDLRGSQLEEAVGKVDVVVMPSLCEETAGLSAIEQMMRGRVVIVADIGGLSEVVGEFGFKFPPGDAEALYRCLRTILGDGEKANRMGHNAKGYALERYSLDRMVREHLFLYAGTANQ